MKRVKELLWFVIPLVLLGVLPVLYVLWLLPGTGLAGFVSGEQYLRLLLDDEPFYHALALMYGKPLLFSTLAVAAFALVRHLLKRNMTMSPLVYRLCSMAIGCITAFVSTLAFRAIAEAAMAVQSGTVLEPAAQTVLDAIFETYPVWSIVTVADVILCLQIGILAALAIRLVEWIVEFAAKRVKRST